MGAKYSQHLLDFTSIELSSRNLSVFCYDTFRGHE